MTLWTLSASELSAKLASREVSSLELVRAHLGRIDDVDGRVRAFTEVMRSEALAEATQRDEERARGTVRGPLHGLPVSIKECLDLEGRATTVGFEARRDHRATRDAALVTLLREAGAVILGRTNLSQGMLFAESRNPIFGQTANPWSLAHTPGGSSGGESAAIAAGMSPLGIGTDIGGSIRGPAHFAGICGLMMTLDRWPMRGITPGLPGQETVRASVGPMARTVADLQLFARALDPRRISQLDVRCPPVAWMEPPPVRGLRIGFFTHDGVFEPSRACTRAVRRAVKVLEEQGAEVVPFAPPILPEAAYTYLAAMSADGTRTLAEQCEGGQVDPVMKGLLRLGGLPDALRRTLSRVAGLAGDARLSRVLSVVGEKTVAQLWKRVYELRTQRWQMLDAMDRAGIDAIVSPPLATPALPHGMSADFSLASSYTYLWNLLHFSAGVVPVTRVLRDETLRIGDRDKFGKHATLVDSQSEGLPVGVHVAARPWHEETALAVMGAIEAVVRGDEGFPLTPVIDPR